MNLREGTYHLVLRGLTPDAVPQSKLVRVALEVTEVIERSGPETPHLVGEVVYLVYNHETIDRLLRDGFRVDKPYLHLDKDSLDSLIGRVVQVSSYVGTIKSGDGVGNAIVKHKFSPVTQVVSQR